MTTKLLAVDDSKTMRKVLEITFAGDTYDSTVVGSADEALASIRQSPPQVAVIDGHLGGSSGYDLCKQIKEAAPSVKVLLLSSKQRPYDASAGSAAGVDEHFDKPFDSTKFLDKLGGMDLAAAAASAPAAAPEPAPAPMAPAPVARPPAPSATSTAAETPSVNHGGSPEPQKPIAPPIAAPKPVEPAPPQPSAPAAAPAPSAPAAAAAAAAGNMTERLQTLGLTQEQVAGVLALSREVLEQVVWEVVPALAETMIKEELNRLTAE